MELIAAVTQGKPELKIFFSIVLVMLLAAGFYMLRHRKKFFSHKSDPSDSYASANLRMAMVILIWIHATIVTIIMIFEV